MKRIRLIARLDIKGQNLIKGIHLEGLRVIGSPSEYAHKYYNQGADELIFMDTVASLYGRNHLGELVPPGTYLMHIEAINWTSGTTTSDMAPVVIGVY